MMNFFKKVEIFWYKVLYLISIIMFVFFMFVSKTNSTYILEFVLFEWNSICFSVPIIVDSISLSFSSLMLFISGSVMMFSNYYMEGEKYMKRFSMLILCFILSMNLLIFVPNIMTLLLGWDGLGVISFLLVIFYQNPKSLGAGMITFLSNRIGDAILIVSIGWMMTMGSWNIFFSNWNMGVVFVLWCITIASMTKSAQIPFSAWLPAAMAAPTPVSALVHSSTLVTAGVYLLIRFHDQIFLLPELSWYILNIGVLTTLMAGMSAVCETDMKKIIALSTLSQLGLMMFSLGLGLKELCIFHLFTHALFKALLFVCAGSMIHSHSHLQDVRKLGSSWYFMPITTSCLNIANLSLCGFPYLSGFFSKDLILEAMLDMKISWLTLIMMVVATLLTTLYSARLTYLSVIKMNNFSPMSTKLEESSKNLVPMVSMTMVSIMSGPSLYWMMNSEVPEPFMNSLEKLMPVALIVMGASIVLLDKKDMFMSNKKMKMFYASSNMWFIAPISSQPLISKFLLISQNNIKLVDQGWNEIIGAQGLYKTSNMLFSSMTKFQLNKINVFFMLFSLNIVFVLIMLG